MEYLLSEKPFGSADAITGDWTELTLDDGKAIFNIEPGRKAYVYVRVTDNSSNITVVNSDGVVVYTDAEAIIGVQTFIKNADFDVVYKLNLNGNFVAKVYNGTEEIGVGSDCVLLANGMLKADIEKLIADIDTLLDGDNLTDAERTALELLKETAEKLPDRISAAKMAAESDEIKAVEGVTKDNVKREDKEPLEKAEKALEDALRDFDGNYTEGEHGSLETKLETVKEALAAIKNAVKAADEIGKLSSVDDVKLGDREDEEAKNGGSPGTGDNSNIALWIALLFVSGGAIVGAAATGKKKKRSVR